MSTRVIEPIHRQGTQVACPSASSSIAQPPVAPEQRLMPFVNRPAGRPGMLPTSSYSAPEQTAQSEEIRTIVLRPPSCRCIGWGGGGTRYSKRMRTNGGASRWRGPSLLWLNSGGADPLHFWRTYSSRSMESVREAIGGFRGARRTRLDLGRLVKAWAKLRIGL